MKKQNKKQKIDIRNLITFSAKIWLFSFGIALFWLFNKGFYWTLTNGINSINSRQAIFFIIGFWFTLFCLYWLIRKTD